MWGRLMWGRLMCGRLMCGRLMCGRLMCGRCRWRLWWCRWWAGVACRRTIVACPWRRRRRCGPLARRRRRWRKATLRPPTGGWRGRSLSLLRGLLHAGSRRRRLTVTLLLRWGRSSALRRSIGRRRGRYGHRRGGLGALGRCAYCSLRWRQRVASTCSRRCHLRLPGRSSWGLLGSVGRVAGACGKRSTCAVGSLAGILLHRLVDEVVDGTFEIPSHLLKGIPKHVTALEGV